MESNLETIVGTGAALFLVGVGINFLDLELPPPIHMGASVTGLHYIFNRIKNKAMPSKHYVSYALGALLGYGLAYKLFTQ